MFGHKDLAEKLFLSGHLQYVGGGVVQTCADGRRMMAFNDRDDGDGLTDQGLDAAFAKAVDYMETQRFSSLLTNGGGPPNTDSESKLARRDHLFGLASSISAQGIETTLINLNDTYVS